MVHDQFMKGIMIIWLPKMLGAEISDSECPFQFYFPSASCRKTEE